jgi:hypothetical protein
MGYKVARSAPLEGLGGGLGVEHPLLEEREAGTAIHAALKQFEFCDLAFRLSLRMSGQLHPMT